MRYNLVWDSLCLINHKAVYEKHKLYQTNLLVTSQWTPTQVIKYNQNFLQADQPIRLQYSNQIKLYVYRNKHVFDGIIVLKHD